MLYISDWFSPSTGITLQLPPVDLALREWLLPETWCMRSAWIPATRLVQDQEHGRPGRPSIYLWSVVSMICGPFSWNVFIYLVLFIIFHSKVRNSHFLLCFCTLYQSRLFSCGFSVDIESKDVCLFLNIMEIHATSYNKVCRLFYQFIFSANKNALLSTTSYKPSKILLYQREVRCLCSGLLQTLQLTLNLFF